MGDYGYVLDRLVVGCFDFVVWCLILLVWLPRVVWLCYIV